MVSGVTNELGYRAIWHIWLSLVDEVADFFKRLVFNVDTEQAHLARGLQVSLEFAEDRAVEIRPAVEHVEQGCAVGLILEGSRESAGRFNGKRHDSRTGFGRMGGGNVGEEIYSHNVTNVVTGIAGDTYNVGPRNKPVGVIPSMICITRNCNSLGHLGGYQGLKGQVSCSRSQLRPKSIKFARKIRIVPPLPTVRSSVHGTLHDIHYAPVAESTFNDEAIS
jgi:hypothetical protein